MKFAREVNGETRKLVKRSISRGGVEEEVYSHRDVVDIDFGVCVGA